MLKLRIISPEKILYTGEATRVKVPGVSGEFEILNNHAPIISALQPGVVMYECDGQRTDINIMGGFVEVQKNNVDLCVEIE
ncbi:MAG: ATP synthase F1 subunit epsilon [Bacteroidaceae bacterium]|nr:ATP synthase F1 subunit epsilon [Bacteroidaceae bacterium]